MSYTSSTASGPTSPQGEGFLSHTNRFMKGNDIMHNEHQEHSEHSHEHGCCSHDTHNHEHCCHDSHEHEHCCHDTHSCGCTHHHHTDLKSDIIIYAISFGLFLISILTEGVLSAIFAIIATLVCGKSIFTQGIKSIFKLRFDENTLILVAAFASILLKEYSEAYIVTLLFGIGAVLEEYAVKKSRKNIESLIDLTTDTAYNELGEKIDPAKIKAGDTFLVKPGDKVCTDAVIISGDSSFDTSGITGESMPYDLSADCIVYSGYINISSSVICRATTDYASSTASKIKHYVEEATHRKASTEKFITKFASIYTPTIIGLALLLAVILAVSGMTNIAEAVRRCLTFMIASCPCSLVISIPLSYYAGVGAISKYGLLIKGSQYINTLAGADAIALDKTGTLTKGKLSVADIKLLGDITEDTAMAYAKAMEAHSSHPIAQAICNHYDGEYPSAEDVKEHFGKGITGTIDGHSISLGTAEFAGSGELDDGIYLAIDGKLQAIIEVSDSMKDDAANMISQLKAIGINDIYMLSGDSKSKVEELCDKLGGIKGFGRLMPIQKADIIEKLKKEHKAVIFAGDGVNDAPSLAKADFSISIGSGSSLALETGDATLMSTRLCSIPKSIKKARQTMRTIYTNIVLSLVIKIAVLILASIGVAPIWLAVFADVGVLIITVIHSLSILRVQNSSRG